MARDLVLDNGKYKERQSGKPFTGQASRDLDVGDIYERDMPKGRSKFVVAEKTVNADGCLVVRSVEVIA